jgi:pectinesterase
MLLDGAPNFQEHILFGGAAVTCPSSHFRQLAGGLIVALSCVALAFASKATPRTIRVVVAANGTGDFRTVQQAIDHAPDERNGRLIIAIRPGVYRGRVRIPETRPRVTMLGLGKNPQDTVITYNMSAAAAGGTFFSSTVDVQSEGFEASNLTIENSYGPGSQAVALSIQSDRAILRRCRLIGWQDTLYAESGRQYYDRCFIKGAVDFIFGDARAVFDRCVIESAGRGYVTAEGRTSPQGSGGYVFYHSRLVGAAGVDHVFLGRPWRPYARVVYVDCWMGSQILPVGWDNWRNPANEKTAWFAEYHSTGPGAHPSERVPWARKLTAAEAARFAPRNFLSGTDGWNPASAEKSIAR